MKPKYVVLPLIVVSIIGLILGGMHIAKAQTQTAPTYSLVDGVLTIDGNVYMAEQKVADTQSVESTEDEVDDLIVMSINGSIVPDWAEVVPGQSVSMTLTIPSGKMVYGFPGGNTGGAWVTGAVVSGATGCNIFNQPGTLQFDCSPSTQERHVTVQAVTTQQFALPAPVINDPYSTIVVNPSPDGAESYDQWWGRWWQPSNFNYLPTVLNGG